MYMRVLWTLTDLVVGGRFWGALARSLLRCLRGGLGSAVSENKRDALTQKHHKQDSNSYILIMYVYTYGSNDKVLQVKYKSRAVTQREGNEQTIVLETAKTTSCRIMTAKKPTSVKE